MGIREHYLDIIKVLYQGHCRPFINKVIDVLGKEWHKRNIFLIEAPTGYGKTVISLAVAKYSVEEELKAVIAYPLRALLEQQVELFKNLLRECGLSEELVGVRYMMRPQSLYLIKPVTLTTVDTLALTTMGVEPADLGKVLRQPNSWGSMGHYVFAWASAFTSNIVIDEAHLLADSGKALTFLSFLAEAAVFHDQHLIVMTATMPPHLPRALKNIAGSERVVEISFSNYLERQRREGLNDAFVKERLRKEYTVEALPVEGEGIKKVMEWVSEVIDCSKSPKPPRVLAVFNTVRDAVEAYRIARREFSTDRNKKVKVILVHSRFTARDREALAKKLDELSRKVREGRDREPYIIIATQAIEAGIDITSNIFVTDAAPPTTVVQRAGRFLRYGERWGKVLIWWSVEGDDLRTNNYGLYKVYNADLVKKVINWIKSNKGKVNLHLPKTLSDNRPGYGELLSTTYKELTLRASARLKELMEDIIIDYFKGSRRAAQLLGVLGGSLVRDSALIPVVPKELIGSDVRLSDLMIPVTPLKLLKLYEQNKVVGMLKGSEITWELPDLIKSRFKEACNYIRRRVGREVTILHYIVRTIMQFNIDSFIVDASYNPEEGLRV